MTDEQQEQEISDLVTTLIKALVDSPDEVLINTVKGRHNIIFEVEVPTKEIGLVLGKEGQNISAVRTILNARCKKARIKYQIDVLTDGNPRK